MRHFHNHSNDLNRDQSEFKRGLSDRRLDELLSLANQPNIGRRRKRRLKKHLSDLLGANRPSLNPGANVAHGVLGAVTACGIVFLVSMLGQFGRRAAVIPPTAKTVATDIAPPEFAKTEINRQIISHVVWTPVENRRPQRLERFLRDRFVQLDRTVNRFADSDFGLNLLEHAADTIDYEIQLAAQSRNRDSRRNVLAVQRMRAGFESVLVQKIESDRSTEQKTLAFRKLCRIGSARTESFVLKHWGNDQLAPDIMIAAKRLADSPTLAQMTVSTNHAELKTELMVELLERSSDESVRLFLDLTERHQLFVVARRSGQRARRFPTAMLLSALQSNRMGVVRAASITLSRVNDPRITERLFKLASHPESRHAAVLALTARQDEQATRFVELAAMDWRWSATVATAQRKWNRLLAVN